MMRTIYGKTLALAAIALSAFVTANAHSIKGTIQLPGLPEQVAVNYLTNRVYVAIPSFGGTTDTLAVIDGKTDSILQQISIPTVAYQVAVDSIHNRIYVGGCFDDANGNNVCEVVVIDGRSNKMIATIPVTTTEGSGIQGLAANIATGKLYISNASDNVIDVVNPNSQVVNAVIKLDGESPSQVAVNSFTNQVYVALATDLVDVIDAKTNTITTSNTVGQTNQGIAVNWFTGNVFVTNNVFGVSTTAVLSKSGAVVANITTGNTPFGVDVDPFKNDAFVTNLTDNTLSVINGKTNAVFETLPVSGTFVAVNPSSQKVYVSGQTSELIVINEN